MFYDENKTIESCDNDPTIAFQLLLEEHVDLLDKIISRKTFDINVVDKDGNNIIMKLLKKGYFDIVLNHLKDKRLDINHQNNDGDTLAHILLSIKNIKVVDIFNELKKIKEFVPNIKNNNNETILDKSIKSGSTYITAKILSDKRFTEVGLVSFKNYYDAYIKNNNYGKYTKLSNLDLLLGNLEDKELSPKVKLIIMYLKDNYELIKQEVINNNTKCIDSFLKEVLFA